MSPTRAPSAPPELDGFTYQRLLGSGGFADVFLYEQHKPRRKVAIKVLLESMLSPAALAGFDAEADLMAQLSSHPSIVNIFQVGRAGDGRPYLVMQFCPGANLGVRYRQAPLGLQESLRIGVEIAGAVETAHRAGILHRDIKPQNILFTEYNEPQLTDFGIASTVEDSAGPEGMSLPWSPPESFDDPPRADVTTDVWALGATVYTLLAGRSPFELPGRSNSSADLMARIESVPVPPIGRADVPASLERVLATAMGKRPDQRYPSALAFARALQQVQTELGFGATPVSVQDDVVVEQEARDDDEPGTRIRRVQSISPDRPSGTTGGGRTVRPPVPVPAAPTARPAVGPASGADPMEGDTTPPMARTVVRGGTGAWLDVPAPPAIEETLHRAAPDGVGAVDPAADEARPSGGRRRTAVVVAVAVVAALGVGAAVLLGGQGPEGADTGPDASGAPSDVRPVDSLAEVVPSATDVRGTLEGDQVVFTWTNPEPEPGDEYLWRLLSLVDEQALTRSAEPTATVPVQEGQTCIEVFVTRDGKASVEPVRGCL